MADWTRATPWRQGHLLTDDARTSLGLVHPDYPDDAIVIVASHDCDLVQPTTNEPLVELVIGRRIDKLDGNHTHAKTARTLHLTFDGPAPLLAEFIATAKCNVSKVALAVFEPAAAMRLSPASLATLQRWLASRYHRSAFPDEFENRLKGAGLAKSLRQALKPHGELISAVLFDVDEGENIIRSGPDDVYILDITLVYVTEPDFDAAEAAANTAKQKISAAFEKKLLNRVTGEWQQLELRHIDVISEEALSYRQFTLMKRWRLDDISLGAEPQQPILAE